MARGIVEISPELLKHLTPRRRDERYSISLQSIIGVPENFVFGDSRQLLLELVFAIDPYMQSESWLESLELSPEVMTDKMYKRRAPPSDTIAIGSPNRNSVVMSVAGNESGLPYRFDMKDQTFLTHGYADYAGEGSILGPHPFNLLESLNGIVAVDQKHQRYLYPQNERKRVRYIKLTGEDRSHEPYFVNGKLSRDYFMIAKLPLTRRNGMQSPIIIAGGCHDLGTYHALSLLEDSDMLEEIERETSYPKYSQYFQVIGQGDKGGDRTILDVVQVQQRVKQP